MPGAYPLLLRSLLGPNAEPGGDRGLEIPSVTGCVPPHPHRGEGSHVTSSSGGGGVRLCSREPLDFGILPHVLRKLNASGQSAHVSAPSPPPPADRPAAHRLRRLGAFCGRGGRGYALGPGCPSPGLLDSGFGTCGERLQGAWSPPGPLPAPDSPGVSSLLLFQTRPRLSPGVRGPRVQNPRVGGPGLQGGRRDQGAPPATAPAESCKNHACKDTNGLGFRTPGFTEGVKLKSS